MNKFNCALFVRPIHTFEAQKIIVLKVDNVTNIFTVQTVVALGIFEVFWVPFLYQHGLLLRCLMPPDLCHEEHDVEWSDGHTHTTIMVNACKWFYQGQVISIKLQRP